MLLRRACRGELTVEERESRAVAQRGAGVEERARTRSGQMDVMGKLAFSIVDPSP